MGWPEGPLGPASRINHFLPSTHEAQSIVFLWFLQTHMPHDRIGVELWTALDAKGIEFYLTFYSVFEKINVTTASSHVFSIE
jgi:hypothetical protein